MALTSTERSRKLREGLTDEQRTAKRAADAERKRRARTKMTTDERNRDRGASRGSAGNREGQRARAFERETGTTRAAVLALNGGVCVYCQSRPADTIDHIFPRILGGSLRADNLVPACRSCNSGKRERDWGMPSWQ